MSKSPDFSNSSVRFPMDDGDITSTSVCAGYCVYCPANGTCISGHCISGCIPGCAVSCENSWCLNWSNFFLG